MRVALLRHLVARTANTRCAQLRDGAGDAVAHRLRAGARFQRGATGEVVLVPAALCVREVVALVRVQREAQLALVAAQVVAHEVRVFRQVYRVHRELPKPLASR